MPVIAPLRPKLQQLISRHSLQKKFAKQLSLLAENPRHPSLHVELLEPKEHGVYSFRIDIKYRALFIWRPDTNVLEILSITVHYH